MRTVFGRHFRPRHSSDHAPMIYRLIHNVQSKAKKAHPSPNSCGPFRRLRTYPTKASMVACLTLVAAPSQGEQGQPGVRQCFSGPEELCYRRRAGLLHSRRSGGMSQVVPLRRKTSGRRRRSPTSRDEAIVYVANPLLSRCLFPVIPGESGRCLPLRQGVGCKFSYLSESVHPQMVLPIPLFFFLSN